MLGTDFELFLSAKNQVVPAALFPLPDKQGAPIVVADAGGPAGFIHRDNLMIEMCTPAVDTADNLVAAVNRVIHAGMSWVNTWSKDTGAALAPLEIWPHSMADFSAHWINSPEGRELGCDADFIAEGHESVQRPRMEAKSLARRRFSGGHVHISWNRDYIPAWVGARLCDLFIGYPEAGFLNQERAKFYGAATLHRPTKYPNGGSGVEYRVLDSYWVRDQEALHRVSASAELVMRLMEEANNKLLDSLVTLHADTQAEPLVVQMSTPLRMEVHAAARRMAAEDGYV